MIDNRGRTLTPCRRKVAEKEVRLNRAKWVGPNKIRLRFDPFAYRYIRLKVLVRDGYTCYWCAGPGDTMDHIIPWSKGGRTTMDNCICACQECNGQRGDMPATEFARLRGVVPPSPSGRPLASPAPRLAGAVAPLLTARGFALEDLLDPYVQPLSRRFFY
ncbi:MAG TPA: HNH endonuclease signature motif containing protein [Symbiobacteriaceae bacterium]